MSLICHLPLDGELKNTGLGDISISFNGVSISNAGKLVKCYSFDGVDDFISLSGKDLYDCFKGGSNPFSIAFWAYNGDGNGSSNPCRAVYFGDYGMTGTMSFNIEKTAAGLCRFYWNSNPDWSVSGSTLPASAWNHIAFVYTGTETRCYVNGSLVGSRSGALAAKSKTSGPFYIGRDTRTGDTAFKGMMNDFRVYDHALCAQEINELKRCLFIHYDFDFLGDSTSKVYDASGNGKHASGVNITEDSDSMSGGTSAKFSGNGYVSLTEATVNGPFSLSVWTKTSSKSTQCLYANRTTAGEGPALFLINGSGGTIRFDTNNINCTAAYPSDGAWHHIVATFDGSTRKIYLDGILKSTLAGTIGNTSSYSSIGGSGTTGLPNSNYMNGLIADWRLYSSCLSADDVADLFKAKASIDRNGSLHVYEIKEEGEDIVLPTKKGESSSEMIREGNSELWLQKSKTLNDADGNSYTRCEYIQSSGTQTINTEYFWKTENTEIEADFAVITNASNQSVWGNEEYYTSSARYFTGVPHGSKGSYSLYIGSGSGTGFSVTLGTRTVIDVATNSSKNVTIKKDGEQIVSRTYSGTVMTRANAKTVGPTTGYIFIFSNHNSGTSGTVATGSQMIESMRVYGFRMWDDGKLVRDFVPCYNSSGTAGLLDLVEMRFHANAGSGTFSKGSDSSTKTIYANMILEGY